MGERERITSASADGFNPASANQRGEKGKRLDSEERRRKGGVQELEPTD